MKYIIEHMEHGFSDWVILEYSAIIKDVGRENLFLTSLPDSTTEIEIPQQLKDVGLQWTTEEAISLPNVFQGIPNIEKSRVCLLDPAAETDLVPEDAEKFDYFVFGGILGDHPPRDRTGELRRKYGFVGKRLGAKQMTTDTAVRVTQLIVDKKIPFDKIPFADFPEFKFNKHETTEMPFRYVTDESGEPILPEGMLKLIKEDSEQTLDGLI